MTADDLIFRSSTFCAVGACIEVASAGDGRVVVRSSQERERTLVFTQDEWTAFVRGVAAGEFGRVDRGL